MSQRNSIIKLPGLADPHVHLREPGATSKEDFFTGTQAAIAGGYTQVLDMPNNNPPTVSIKALEDKQKLAKGKIWCDLGFNFGATAQSTAFFITFQKEVFGLKVYMSHTTGPLIVEKKNDLSLVFEMWQSPLPILIHAQDELVEVAIKLAKKYKKAIHICHVTANQLDAIEKARKDGQIITCEVTPHHLFLTKNDEKRLKGFGVMKPPLMSARDAKKLWDNIDKIDVIATDHAPHTLEEKTQADPLFGVGGLETTLPLMFTAIAQEKLTREQLINMCATNPRKIFHLPQQIDTFVLVDFSHTFTISAKSLFTKNKWTPFEGMSARGLIKKVVLRGKPIFSEGEFVGNPQGQIIKPIS